MKLCCYFCYNYAAEPPARSNLAGLTVLTAVMAVGMITGPTESGKYGVEKRNKKHCKFILYWPNG